MKNSKIKKISFSYEKLSYRSVELSALMKRDTTKFSEFSVKRIDVIEFDKKLNAFKKLEQDIKILNTQKQASSDKNNAAKELRLLLNNMQIKTEQALSSGTTEIRLINLGKTSSIELENLSLISESYLQILSQRKSELYKYGLTTKDLINLEFGINKFNKARMDQAVARIDRGLSAQLRAIKANELYIEYNKYVKIGKQMWLQSNLEKSKEYNIV